MTNPPMSLERFRVAPTDWADLKATAPPDARAAILRDLIRWYLRRPGAELPERPPRTGPDTCGAACEQAHTYETGCLVHPMLIGAIRSHTEMDSTSWSWICSHGGDCEGLRHLGYQSLPAARRAYDQHLRTDHSRTDR